jgi:superfamily II DNA or RNA helicase
VTTAPAAPRFAEGTLVRARDREWVVIDASDATFLLVRPLAGADEDVTALAPSLEDVTDATFPPPTADDLGDATAARLLRDGLRIGFRASGGPFRSLAGLAVTPRAYQYVPLLMALRQGGDAVRLLIADGVGIGKTVEAGLVAAELLAQGDARRLAVLCSPALAPQWREELRTKFNIDATLVLPSTVNRLQRGLAMGESLFDRNPFVVVSTDLIKQRTYRDEFARACPELVIVDEAHSSVTASGANSRGSATLRHHLLQRLADDKNRHLIMLTATPHQGNDDGWHALLALLDPSLENLPADLSGPQHEAARAQLARYFVQRQRGDITDYLDEDTPFPDRATTEETYKLHEDYRKLIDRVLNYARETVTDADVLGTVRQRVRWWSMVALLRSLASSPAAAVTTLRNRAATQQAISDEEADEIGRAVVLDEDDEAATDADDITPGADDSTDATPANTTRRRLLEFARQAETLMGPGKDHKLARVTKMVTKLIDDGFDPIVFCRYIPTAEYVGDHLRKTLGNRARVETVTGTLPPEAREAAVKDLGEHEGHRVLVATDCLSEGVNLQDYFTAVIHYDLAWNPTRHEQREGRIDRFGQRAKTVRAITYYGVDNPVDGVVLDVLIRKHETIKKSTGVSVAMPTDSALVMQAVFEGLILRGQDPAQETLFEMPGFGSQQELFDTWQHTAERERRSRSRFAQNTINPSEVARELASVRDALGGPADVERFVRHALTRLSSTLTDLPDGTGFTATLAPLPRGLRDLLPVPPKAVEIAFVRDLPAPIGAYVLNRTDTAVEALASYTLDAALDPLLAPDFRPARRSGVMRTTAVTDTTTLLVTRMRFHLTLPGRDRDLPLVVEEAHLAAFTGTPNSPSWLDDDALAALLDAVPSGNVAQAVGKAMIAPVLSQIDAVLPHLSGQADNKAEQLADAHRRVRESARTSVRGLRVQAQHPVDILGVYTFLPGDTS